MSHTTPTPNRMMAVRDAIKDCGAQLVPEIAECYGDNFEFPYAINREELLKILNFRQSVDDRKARDILSDARKAERNSNFSSPLFGRSIEIAKSYANAPIYHEHLVDLRTNERLRVRDLK